VTKGEHDARYIESPAMRIAQVPQKGLLLVAKRPLADRDDAFPFEPPTDRKQGSPASKKFTATASHFAV
jgi:hypothetical protein